MEFVHEFGRPAEKGVRSLTLKELLPRQTRKAQNKKAKPSLKEMMTKLFKGRQARKAHKKNSKTLTKHLTMKFSFL